MKAIHKVRYAAADNEALRRLYPHAPMAAIHAALPGRTWFALSRQANKLGIKRTQRGFTGGWSQAEKDTLRQHYAAMPQAELLALLPGRTWLAVANQAVRLGLARVEWHRHAWTAQHLELLRTHYPTKGGAYVAQLVGRPAAHVNKAAGRLGIKREWPAPAPRVRKPRPAKPKVVKVKAVKAKPAKPVKPPKPPKVVAAKPPKAPVAKALPLPGVQDNTRTPLLNAAKTARLAAEAQAKKTLAASAIVPAAELAKLPYTHPARMAYMLGARMGGAAANRAYHEAMNQLKKAA